METSGWSDGNNDREAIGGEPGLGYKDQGIQLDEIRRRETLFRLVAWALLAVVLHLHHWDDRLGQGKPLTPVTYVLILAYLAFAVLVHLDYRWLGYASRLGWIAAVVDTAAVCAVIYETGGLDSHIYLFLGIAPLIGGIYRRFKGAIFAYMLCALFYGVAVALRRDLAPGTPVVSTLLWRYLYLSGAAFLSMYVVDEVLKDRRRLKILNEISQSTSRSPAMYHVVREISHRLAEIFRAEVACIYIKDESSRLLKAQVPVFGYDHFGAVLDVDLTGGGLLARLFSEGNVTVMKAAENGSLDVPPFTPPRQVRNLLAIPLSARGKNIGMALLLNGKRGFSEGDRKLADMLAPHLSVLVDNALLYLRTEEKVAQLTSLIRVVDAMGSLTDIGSLCELALDVAKGLFAVDKALIMALEGEEGRVKILRQFGFSQDYTEKYLERLNADSRSCLAIDGKDPYLCRDMHEDPLCSHLPVDPQVKSVLCVPLRSGDVTFGVMFMASSYSGAFGEDDVSLAKAIGEQLGLAMQRAWLFEEVNRLAITDELTGLYNYRHLRKTLGEESTRALRYGRNLSFIMLDIDHFKLYNDRHGHTRGDEVLRILADILKANTREVDMVFRYGGEEFSILAPELSKNEAYLMAERLRRLVEEHPFPLEESQPGGRITVSMGVASLPEDTRSPEELVDLADHALYMAKSGGRNRVFRYGEEKTRHLESPNA